MFLQFVVPVNIVFWFSIRRLSFWPNPIKQNHMDEEQDFSEAILFVLRASIYQP